ncbi:MAG: DUF1801 domain-containing protein [Gammaproteobacteria bacterium]|nr:DUF1801 domain-containing protein [Gammaproteobacteria bacterium]
MTQTKRAGNKTVPTGASVEQFLDAVENPVRRRDCRAVMTFMAAETGETPKMWGPSIIGFGRYRYAYPSGRQGEMPLTGVSPRKQSLVLYIMPGFQGCAKLLERLGKHKTGKSCLYINKLDDVDNNVLCQLIRESVCAMRAKYHSD